MELNDLKSAWAQYDKKLSDALHVNAELLKRMNLGNSKLEMQKPLLFELVSATLMLFLLIYLTSIAIHFRELPLFSIPAVFSGVVTSAYLLFAIRKLNKYIKIDYFGSSVVQLQKDLALLNQTVCKLRKIELLLLPLLVVFLLPIMFKVIHNISIYDNLLLLSFEVPVILGITYPVVIWMNKYLYDSKFKNAERLLKELEKFVKE